MPQWPFVCPRFLVAKLAQEPGAQLYVPEVSSLPQLRDAAQSCRGCQLYRTATQAVLGEGPPAARIVLVGEQPGDKEDAIGRPFVGPAGELLDRALDSAGIQRSDVYVTNAVKHFKFEERGKRRIHKRPSTTEIAACKLWLEAELAIIKPELIVCLGATAARSLIGPRHRLTEERGRFFPHPMASAVTATIHPSAILRAPSAEQRRESYEMFVKDLVSVRARLNGRTRRQ